MPSARKSPPRFARFISSGAMPRARYAKLQQSSDAELETLRQQEIELRSQLELTTRKLENLTDIERQLSSRKPGGNFSPDAGHGGEKVPEVIHDDP